ncbi:hypothetical protein SAMN04488045_0465 [Thalassococcus halodurans]|uniref:Flp pilus assembly protein, pilin Flp n=1 Tax=Thalassococcus halodurans TaxID=373675 RepID=A0A1H5T4F4_9RHOB|nr:hypothetical protein [Thalassococcus halodurans]SEF57038.1 hypothetical protein SAMN04488045_0465 [Thalassococcus halodurans]
MNNGFLSRFVTREDGAVTVDWVVLTAGIVGLCLYAYWQIEISTKELAQATATAIYNEE